MAKRFLTKDDLTEDPVGCVYDAILADLGRDQESLLGMIRSSLASRDYASALTFAIALEASRQRDESRADADAGSMRALERFERCAELLSEVVGTLPPREGVNGAKKS